MQIHAVKHLLTHLEEYETMFQLCSTFLPAPHGAIFSCTSCIFSERLCCLSSVLTQLALHQTGLFPVTYVRSSFGGDQTWINYAFTLFLSQTYNTDTQVPDSAGTATAMFSGVKTRAGMLGLDATAAYNVCAPASIQVNQGDK